MLPHLPAVLRLAAAVSLALLVPFGTAWAETDVPQPKVGASTALTMRQTREQPTPGGAMTIVAETPVKVEVAAGDDGGRIVRWSRGELELVDVDGPPVRQNPTLKPQVLEMVRQQGGPLLKTADGLTFELAYDAGMTYLGLRNADDVRDAIRQTLTALRQLQDERGVARDPRADAAVEELIGRREMIEQVLPKEALQYLQPHRLELRRGQTRMFTAESPNALGGPPMSITYDATLEERPGPNGEFVVTIRARDLDADAVLAGIERLIRDSPGAKPLGEDEREAAKSLKIESSATFHIDPATGLSTWAEAAVRTTVSGETRSERTTWTAAPAE